MKQTLMSILLLSSALWAEAQQNNLFGDLGLPLDLGLPGVSVTYNRKLVKWFGVGVGAQGYFYSRQDMHNNNVEQFTPAVFADLRGYIPIKK
jgi:hypothetical protein